jgi:hypothetical protein
MVIFTEDEICAPYSACLTPVMQKEFALETHYIRHEATGKSRFMLKQCSFFQVSSLITEERNYTGRWFQSCFRTF